VAEFALRAIFAAMQISVTILAFLRSITEHEGFVAIGTLYFCVAATQRKFRLRMTELKLGTERLPALSRVTFLARNFELVAVRAANGIIRRSALTRRKTP